MPECTSRATLSYLGIYIEYREALKPVCVRMRMRMCVTPGAKATHRVGMRKRPDGLKNIRTMTSWVGNLLS